MKQSDQTMVFANNIGTAAGFTKGIARLSLAIWIHIGVGVGATIGRR
jgi:hypothetical protein